MIITVASDEYYWVFILIGYHIPDNSHKYPQLCEIIFIEYIIFRSSTPRSSSPNLAIIEKLEKMTYSGSW